MAEKGESHGCITRYGCWRDWYMSNEQAARCLSRQGNLCESRAKTCQEPGKGNAEESSHKHGPATPSGRPRARRCTDLHGQRLCCCIDLDALQNEMGSRG